MRITTRDSAPSGLTRFGAVALLALLLTGCQAARMPVPDTLAATERMPVSGRQGLTLNQRLRFGPYEAHDVRRSWTRGRDRGRTATATQSDRRQEYRFTLREGGQDHWYVVCRAALVTVRIDAGVVDVHPIDESALYCNLQSLENAAVAWQLELQEQRERPLSGTLVGGGARLQVAGTNRLDRSLPLGLTSGYEFRDAGDVVGAVEVINRGAVWLRGDLDAQRRQILSAASAALLLLEDLRETART